MSFLPSNSQMNTGKDCTLQLVINGVPIGPFALFDDYKRSSIEKELEMTPQNMGGLDVRRTTYHGWQYEITATRNSSTFDLIQNALQAAYTAGGVPQTVTGTETIAELNGTATQFNLIGGNIVTEGGGNVKGGEKIDGLVMRVKFQARTEAGGTTNPFTAPFTQASTL